MKASLQQRVEYLGQQLLYARVQIQSYKSLVARSSGVQAESLIAMMREGEHSIASIDERLEKVARVLQGSEPPTAKRGRLDYDAPVADPMED